MSQVKDLIIEELKLGAKLSKEYMKKIENSKTKTKKSFYQKKLEKNNDLNAKMVLALDRMSKGDENEQTPNEQN
jgi:hypothetical protein